MCFNNLLQTKVNIVHAVSHYTFSLCCPALLSTSLLTLSVSSCGRLCNGTASVGRSVRPSVCPCVYRQPVCSSDVLLACRSAAGSQQRHLLCSEMQGSTQSEILLVIFLHVRYTAAICDV